MMLLLQYSSQLETMCLVSCVVMFLCGDVRDVCMQSGPFRCSTPGQLGYSPDAVAQPVTCLLKARVVKLCTVCLLSVPRHVDGVDSSTQFSMKFGLQLWFR